MSAPGPDYYVGENGGLDAGDIAGIVVGVSLGIPLLMAVCWGFLICYRRKIAPRTSGRPKPESNKDVADRIRRDFGTGEETAEENGEHKEVAIEMVEPATLTTVTSTTTATTTVGDPSTTPSTTLETTPDSGVHIHEATTAA